MSKVLSLRVCELCGKEYTPCYGKQRFCGNSCSLRNRHSTRELYTYNCLTCGKECSTGAKKRFGVAKYCSFECHGKQAAQQPGPVSSRFKAKENAYYKTVPHYQAIHLWIRTYWGVADTCEFCDGAESQQFEWANVSGEYRRYDRSDWIQLCKKCHWHYDRRESAE